MNNLSINKSLTKHKLEIALATYLNKENFYYDKSVWRLLLKQYYEENGNYPLTFDKNGFVNERSLEKFTLIMEKFTERIVSTIDPLWWSGDNELIVLSFKTGLAEITIKLTKLTK